VFCCVVIPGTCGDAKSGVVAVRNEKSQIFVAPNNGLLTHVLGSSSIKPVEAYFVQNQRVLHLPLSPTFDGRDIVASCAAHLAGGFPLAEVGPAAPIETLTTLPVHASAIVEAKRVVGEITIIDKNFGNVWTNIPTAMLHRADILVGDELEVIVGQRWFDMPFRRTFSQVERGELVGYVNSRDHLAMGLNCGSFAEMSGVRPGEPLTVQAVDAQTLLDARSKAIPALWGAA
jgi:S-adenosylmethionine hydrolase